MEGGAVGHNFERDTPRDHLCQVWTLHRCFLLSLAPFGQAVIKRTIHGLYSRKIAPTFSIIHKEIKDSIKISKSKLTLTLIDLGYTYKKIGDNRRVLYDQVSIINYSQV